MLLPITDPEVFGDLEEARDYADLDRKGFGRGGKKASRKGSIGSYWVRKGGNDGREGDLETQPCSERSGEQQPCLKGSLEEPPSRPTPQPLLDELPHF